MQRSLTRKAKTRMEMGGGGGTSTGTRQPDILSLVLPLKSLSSLETGLLVGKGGGVFLILVATMAFTGTKIS